MRIRLYCLTTLEHALTFSSSSEPEDDVIFLTFYLLFLVCSLVIGLLQLFWKVFLFVSLLHLNFR